jgi:hypothetical protein
MYLCLFSLLPLNNIVVVVLSFTPNATFTCFHKVSVLIICNEMDRVEWISGRILVAILLDLVANLLSYHMQRLSALMDAKKKMVKMAAIKLEATHLYVLMFKSQ